MNRLRPVEPEKALSKIKEFLQIYRMGLIEDGAVKGYMKALSGLTEEEMTTAMDIANRENETDYAPVPSVIYRIAMEMRDGATHEASDEMNTWEKTDTNWPEVREFLALLHEIVDKHKMEKEERYKERVKSLGLGQSPPTSGYSNREIIDWYARQDLNNGLPRSKAEIEAIKATQPKRRKRQPYAN